MNGARNLWIVKPGSSSRGRKIQVFNKLDRILAYTDIDRSIFHEIASKLSAEKDRYSKKIDGE